jgi:RNA polymerase sigma factor (sigma-70 family)
VMVQLWHALAVKKLKLREPILALTETIACRRCVDWMRRHRSTQGLSETAVDGKKRPDETLLESERQELARRVLAELKAPCADLMRLVLDEGRSYAEVAREQGRSEHALRTRMWQCLQEARNILRRLSDVNARRSDERSR